MSIKLYFRRVLFALVVLSMIVLPNSGVEKAKAWSTLDQFTLTADGYWRIQTHQILGQGFRPTFNKLDGVGIYAGILPAGPANCVLNVQVYDASMTPGWLFLYRCCISLLTSNPPHFVHPGRPELGMAKPR